MALAYPVYIIDDDSEVRRSLSFILTAEKTSSRPFASGADLLASLDQLQPGCILLDVRMPNMDGLEVMAELSRLEVTWPVVVMTAHGEIAMAVRAMKLGAVDFLEKPFAVDALHEALYHAFDAFEEGAELYRRKQQARANVNNLGRRERDVLRGLLGGQSNKTLAYELGVSVRTIEMHRANMMGRMQVRSLAEALTLAIAAGIEPSLPGSLNLEGEAKQA